MTGTAAPTESSLAQFTYQFDSGTVISVSVDPATGSVDTALDLSRLAVGVHTLNLRVQDQVGDVTLAAPIPPHHYLVQSAEAPTDLSLASVQPSWLKDCVAGAQVPAEDDEEWLIALPE